MDAIKVTKAWVTDADVWIRTDDGREASESIADYPRLRFATPEQREHFTLSDGGIHWRELDEDLNFEGFFEEKNATPLYRLFVAHPELNASAIARRLRMSQSLFAQYVSGTKKPSAEREKMILDEIRNVGRELAAL